MSAFHFFSSSEEFKMLRVEMVLVQQPIPALLDKNFHRVPPQTKAVSYPEGVVLIDDKNGKTVLDENFQYVDMQ